MPTDVIGLYGTPEAAQQAAQALEQAGFADVRVAARAPQAPPAPTVEARAESGWDRLLAKLHLVAPRHDAEFYAQGVQHGETLVSVTTADDRADEAVILLDRFGPLNLDERTAPYQPDPRGSEAPTLLPSAEDPTATQVMDAATLAQLAAAPPATPARDVTDRAVIPIVEEQLVVGKQQAPRGTVRVYQHVAEQPVEEQVTLRERHVSVDRRPADRAVTDADHAFEESVIEMTETEEEAVIGKTARVVEEVVVSKVATEHIETVRETVRHTEVEVEEVGEVGAETQTRPREAR